MLENVKKFFEIYNSDEELRKKVKAAEAAYPGSLEIRDSLCEAVLLPFAREMGLPFSLQDLRVYETKIKSVRESTPVEEEGEDWDDEPVYWLVGRGWSGEEVKFTKD